MILGMQLFTDREKRLIAFVLGAALVGLGVKHWREQASLAPAIQAAGEPS